MTGRTTVADVVVDGLRRAGTPYLVGLAHGGADLSVLAAARAIGMPIVLASTVRGACVMAAVAGDLADAPGAAAIGDAPDALPSALERGPMVLIMSPTKIWPRLGPADISMKATLLTRPCSSSGVSSSRSV